MNITTANRLVQYRKQRGMSQEELAASLGLSRQAVSKWERAEASPDTDNLIALARLYGVSLDELLLSQEPPEPTAKPTVEPTPQPVVDNPPPAAPDVAEYLEYEVQSEVRASIATDYGVDKTHLRNRLSPAAQRVFDLICLGCILAFLVFYGILSLIFPSLYDAYAIVCTIIYLCMGFFADWWHPGWMIYLTIPLYYIFF